MIVAIFGGTGRTGRLAVERLLGAGHEVAVLARDPARVEVQDPRLRVVPGDVRDGEAVRATLRGAQVAVVAIGVPLRQPGTTLSVGTETIVREAQAAGVGRLIVVSADGVGDSRRAIPWLMRIGYHFVGAYMAEKERQERSTCQSGLEWIIVRPAQLTDGLATGRAVTSRMAGARSDVSRADLAAFLVAQLDSNAFVGQAPGLFGREAASG